MRALALIASLLAALIMSACQINPSRAEQGQTQARPYEQAESGRRFNSTDHAPPPEKPLVAPCAPLYQPVSLGYDQSFQPLILIVGRGELGEPIEYLAQYFDTNSPSACASGTAFTYAPEDLSIFCRRGLVSARGLRPMIRTPRVPGGRPKVSAMQAPAETQAGIVQAAAKVVAPIDTLVAWRSSSCDVVYFYSTDVNAAILLDVCFTPPEGTMVQEPREVRSGQRLEIYDSKCDPAVDFKQDDYRSLVDLVTKQHDSVPAYPQPRGHYNPFVPPAPPKAPTPPTPPAR